MNQNPHGLGVSNQGSSGSGAPSELPTAVERLDGPMEISAPPQNHSIMPHLGRLVEPHLRRLGPGGIAAEACNRRQDACHPAAPDPPVQCSQAPSALRPPRSSLQEAGCREPISDWGPAQGTGGRRRRRPGTGRRHLSESRAGGSWPTARRRAQRAGASEESATQSRVTEVDRRPDPC